jgi:agmatinase
MREFFRGGNRFLGLSEEESEFDRAPYLILPVPYDCTTSYSNGTRNGPRAIIEASKQVEFFDAELEFNLTSKVSIHTLDEVEPDYSSPENMVKRIKKICDYLNESGKFIITLGGEHTISLGPIFSHLENCGENFSILQIDAHSDLRDEYEGTKYNHVDICSLPNNSKIKS